MGNLCWKMFSKTKILFSKIKQHFFPTITKPEKGSLKGNIHLLELKTLRNAETCCPTLAPSEDNSEDCPTGYFLTDTDSESNYNECDIFLFLVKTFFFSRVVSSLRCGCHR
jgi:hypothetical protein